MKKWLMSFALVCSAAAFARADFMLVYENKEALEKGRYQTGTALTDGVLVPAALALSGGPNLMIGVVDGDLYKASLLRLDNEIGLAVLKGDERIFDAALLESHKKNSERINRFVPPQTVVLSTDTSRGEAIGTALASSEPFLLRIDGKIAGSEPITLPVKSKKSKFKLDIIRPKAEGVWHVDLRLESDPKLSFWNAKEQASLSKVPEKVFKYSHQVMFRPLAEGRFITVPVEVHFIKQADYVWTFVVTSKKEKFEQKVKIHFEEDKK